MINLVTASPNYGKLSFKEKVFKRLRSYFANIVQDTPFQFKAYLSFWHYYFSKNKISNSSITITEHLYITQKPDYGAGIGHQLSNWNSGYYFSIFFGINYAHSPFSSPKWESFFEFGKDEIIAKNLIVSTSYTKVRLPRFDSSNNKQLDLIQSIIKSYSGQKVLFLLEINQGYWRQCDTYTFLQRKFFNAKDRQNDRLIFKDESYNIAIHIRRRMAVEDDSTWKARGLENIYFANILKSVLGLLKTKPNVNIYLFSQGNQNNFPEFKEFENLYFCMEMGPYESFLHMVNADLLISSKSSFSYKPSLISKNIKICPNSFWHSYPDTPDFILADNEGKFDLNKLINVI